MTANGRPTMGSSQRPFFDHDNPIVTGSSRRLSSKIFRYLRGNIATTFPLVVSAPIDLSI